MSGFSYKNTTGYQKTKTPQDITKRCFMVEYNKKSKTFSNFFEEVLLIPISVEFILGIARCGHGEFRGREKGCKWIESLAFLALFYRKTSFSEWYPVAFLFSDILWCFCKKTRQFLFLSVFASLLKCRFNTTMRFAEKIHITASREMPEVQDR